MIKKKQLSFDKELFKRSVEYSRLFRDTNGNLSFPRQNGDYDERN